MRILDVFIADRVRQNLQNQNMEFYIVTDILQKKDIMKHIDVHLVIIDNSASIIQLIIKSITNFIKRKLMLRQDKDTGL